MKKPIWLGILMVTAMSSAHAEIPSRIHCRSTEGGGKVDAIFDPAAPGAYAFMNLKNAVYVDETGFDQLVSANVTVKTLPGGATPRIEIQVEYLDEELLDGVELFRQTYPLVDDLDVRAEIPSLGTRVHCAADGAKL